MSEETKTVSEGLDRETLKKAVESLLFITDQPLSVEKLAKVTGEKDPDSVRVVLLELQTEYENRRSPVQILEIAEGYQMATRPEQAAWVRRLYQDRLTFRLSNAGLETLSIVAYRQPLTRAEIEDIRGVEVIAALETLLEKRLIRVVGRKEAIGRPLLYGTTPEFLRHFGLKSLEQLPELDSLVPAEPAPPSAPAEQSGEEAPPAAEASVEPEAESEAEPAASEPEAGSQQPSEPALLDRSRVPQAEPARSAADSASENPGQ